MVRMKMVMNQGTIIYNFKHFIKDMYNQNEY